MFALQRAFRGRLPCELMIARDVGQVGLFLRASPDFLPLAQAQLQAAYPDLRIEAIRDEAFHPQSGEICSWARLRLVPTTAKLILLDSLLDRQERQLVDPLAGVFAAIASKKAERLRPLVSILARSAGPITRWRMRRYASEKFHGPLWVVEIRLAVMAPPTHRSEAVLKLRELAGAFGHFLTPDGGRLKLSLVRRSALPSSMALRRRWLLTPAELAMLWHAPTASVRTPQLKFNESRALEPPAPGMLPTLSSEPHLAVLGRTAFRERREIFGILPEDRFRHTYIAGQTGTGKTTLLTNLIAADVAAGLSVVVLDPHGDMIERLLDTVPSRRTNDVIVFDPSDRGQAVAYNPLACRTVAQRPLIASAVVGSFKRLFGDSWGPRLEHILRHCVLTLLENPDATLVSLHRVLVDDSFRKQLVGRVGDEMVRAFWQSEWARWTPQFRAEALSPVLNKVGAFTANPILRSVLGNAEAKLDLRDVLDSGRVLFCNLSKGRLGDDASSLLGSLLVAGVQLAALSRADIPEHNRRPAMLFVDEFQNFVASETFPTLLSEMRKYRIALHAAHQYQEQLDEATAAAVWGNVGTIVAFRLGQDAEIVAEQLGGDLMPTDLRCLPQYRAYVRLLIHGVPSRPFSMMTLPPPLANSRRAAIVRRVSRQRFGMAAPMAT